MRYFLYFSGMGKGILQMIQEAPEIAYDPGKGVTMDDLDEMFCKLRDYKPRKPEYILSKWEAKNLPMWQLNWLGENHIVLTSLEVHNIVKQREQP